MIFFGVDPGKSGAIAMLDEDGVIETIKFSETWPDVVAWIRERIGDDPCFAVVEKVNAMPKQGVTSMFKFGESYGMIQGLLISLHVPFERVVPLVWQREMKCQTKGKKNVTKQRAQELYPKLKITHAIADAVLIATFAERFFNYHKGKVWECSIS